MKYCAAMSLIFTLGLLAGCGGGDPYEQTAEDIYGVSQDVLEVVKGVDDMESAKAAGPKLEKLGQQMQEILDRAKELEEPSDEKKKELEDKYDPKFKEVGEAIGVEIERIQGIGLDVLMELMKQMENLNIDSGPDW